MDWRLQDLGLGLYSIQKPPCSRKATREPYSLFSPAPDPGGPSIRVLMVSEVLLPPGCKPWPF